MESKNGNTNFWISYADLMAGLLFVFILLIGAIIVKYSLLQSESKLLEKSLNEEKIALEKNQKVLRKKEQRIKSVIHDLEKTKDDLKLRLLENEKIKLILDEKKLLIKKQKKDITSKKDSLNAFLLSSNDLKKKLKSLDEEKKELLLNIQRQDNKLKNKDEKILFFSKQNDDYKNTVENLSVNNKNLELNLEKLNSLSKNKEEKLNNLLEDLLLKEKLISSFKDKNEILNKEIQNIEENLNLEKQQNNTLLSNKNEYKEKIRVLIEDSKEYKEKIETFSKTSEQKELKLNKLIEELLVKKSLIASFKEKNNLLDDEMKVMEQKLTVSKKEHKILSKELVSTKLKIKNFTGIKVKVISQLKSKLGDSIQIDSKDGSLRLASNILFDEGEFELKESSQKALNIAVYDYLKTILENEEINKHIDKIIIEGHTNSKGTFLYNLELSQKRAYSVMDFILSLDFDKKENLKKLIVASGRSFLDPIYGKNRIEDKDESRRIEIKFSLKNEDAIKEIANILE